MYSNELMQQAKAEAKEAKEKLKKTTPAPAFAMGGGGMGGGTISRASLMKNDENIRKSRYVDFVIDYIAEEAPYLSRNIIPHPIAWHMLSDGKTYYLHSVDGEEVECAYTKNDSETIIHRLIVGNRTIVDADRIIKNKNNYGPFGRKK